MNNIVQHLCTNGSHILSGIKETGGDFRSNHPAVELCSIQNCEKLDDSAEKRLRELYHTYTGYENL